MKALKPLREKCPNIEFFPIRIFPCSDWIRENTEHRILRILTLYAVSVIIKVFSISLFYLKIPRVNKYLCKHDSNDNIRYISIFYY